MTQLPIRASQEETLTPEDLADLERPGNVDVSPSGALVVYDVRPASKKGDKNVSSIWLADMGKEDSSRQMTSGFNNDRVPQFAPDEDCITFLSDRAEPGESEAIYCLPLAGGEAFPLTDAEHKKSIDSYQWSPSGRFIAFLSPDEKTKGEEDKEKEKDDPVVYGENWEFNRLRLLHVSTREVTVLCAKEGHITEFAWSEDETKIAYISQKTTAIESGAADGMDFEVIDISRQRSSFIAKFQGDASDLIWYDQSRLHFLSNVAPQPGTVSSQCVYEISLENGKWHRHSYGESECAATLQLCGKHAVVHVQSGLHDQLRPLVQSNDKLWDQQRVIHTWHFAQKKPIFALGLSSPDRPTEIYSADSSSEPVRLSNHSAKLASKLPLFNTEAYYCNARDGTKVDGLFITPTKARRASPWPTLVYIHGGPYARASVSFDNSNNSGICPSVLSGGEVAILSPNYRGSSSHGEAFASKIRGRMGTEDYTDVIDMIKAAIKDGLVDKDRVMVGGWSQGGFLSYLTVARNNEAEQGFKLRGAICGAGVTDWDMMCMSSDVPVFESELAGPSPWETDVEDRNNRQGSAIWHMKKLAAAGREQTPVLILHGEEDQRVPHTQAMAFHRACLRYGIPCEFVTYPREPHSIGERAHQIDLIKRVRRFAEMHLL